MPKVRNITVAVSPELYRQTRHIAVEGNTNVTELVRHILIHLPKLLRRTNHPAADWTGIPRRPSPPAAPAPSAPPAAPASSAPPANLAPPAPQPAAPAPKPPRVANSKSRTEALLAKHSASLARERAAALRTAQRLLNR